MVARLSDVVARLSDKARVSDERQINGLIEFKCHQTVGTSRGRSPGEVCTWRILVSAVANCTSVPI